MKATIITVFLGSVVCASVLGDTHYVNVNNPTPLSPYTNWTQAATIIQDAINVAVSGDTVRVTNGVYSTGGAVTPGASLTNRIVVTNAVLVESVNGPGVTIILGQGPLGDSAVRCAYLASNAVLSGFTLSNGFTRIPGSYEDQSGGGAYGGTVNNCVIAGNHAQCYGGGTFRSTVNKCMISGNLAKWGGGIADSTVNNCTISGNTAGEGGGGVDGGTVNNCVIIGNSALAGVGGGIEFGTVNNSVISGNSAPYGGGTYSAWAINCTITGNSADFESGGSRGSSIDNSVVYYNSAPDSPNFYNTSFEYSCTTPNPGGTGNMTNEPLLASISHLASNSPCIGAGSYALCSGTDIDGEAWLNPPSMGCDQYVAGGVTGLLTVAIDAEATNTAVNFTLHFSTDISEGSFGQGKLYKSVWTFDDGSSATNQPYVARAWSTTGSYAVILSAYNDTYPAGVSATVMVEVVDQPIHYVNLNNASPSAPYSSWATAATNIQDAINACSVLGSKVLVTNGVYSTGGAVTPGGSMTNRIVVSDGITVESVNGPAVTIILGQGPLGDSGAIRCAYLANNAVLSGFTLSNGFTRTSGPYKDQDGGGVLCGTVNNCIISGNSAKYGGGIAYATVNNCAISGNTATSYGGGAELCMVNNCTITGNSGGAAVWWGTINNSIVYYNSANFSSGTFQYSCTTPNPGGTGNITYEPRFVDYAGGDLHLSSSSMCINAGNNAYAPGTKDIEGNDRIRASIVDMGAYESPYAPIDASAGPGGSITPLGRVGVVYNGSTNFNVTADTKFYIASIKTNDAHITGSPFPTNALTSTNYVWSNITSNGTIIAEFATTSTCTITASKVGNGSISPSGDVVVAYNGSTNFNIMADPYYRIESIETNGADITGSPYSDNTFTNTTYTWSNVTANGALEAWFAQCLATNGVPYEWLAGYGLTNYDVDAMNDADGDGLLTWEEYVAGTDPTNRWSVLAISNVTEFAATNIVISWHSATGKTYAVDRCLNLVTGDWQVASSNIPDTAPLNTVTVGTSEAKAFYRIQVEQ